MTYSLSEVRRFCSVLLFCAQLLIVSALVPQTITGQAVHPLDPLTSEEIKAAAGVITALPQFPEGSLFSTIVLKEPSKKEVLSHKSGAPFGRQAFAVILDRKGNRTFEAVVDPKAGRLISWEQIKGVQPLVTGSEFEALPDIVKADVRWQEAMRKRGINDFEKVQIDGWAVGQVDAAHEGIRLLRALSYFKGSPINFYGQPIEGVVALVNMNTGKVIEVVDTGVVPLAPPSQELDEQSTGIRKAPKPLTITQPAGASFELNGQEVSRQKWRFRFTMHPREGLVLHTVGYEDAGRVRPILHRASLSEMVVPYGDAETNWRWRSAFDVGEYSVGRLASSIEPNTDAPENAMLIDATFAGDDGQPYVLPRSLGLYERDGGMLLAPHHQHFFSFRLDLDVDGPNNSVHEMNTRALPAGRTNPFLNGILMEETVLKTEREAQRLISMPLARTWMVVNPTAQNSLGQHTSYILVPGSNSLPYIAPTSQVRRRAGFINKHFWATRYKPDEMSAAGVYPNQSRGGDGLPRWVANNEALVNQDVVIWYTLGVTHIPRPEEWPVMPVTHVGFKMIPGGFFSRNPALDVPR